MAEKGLREWTPTWREPLRIPSRQGRLAQLRDQGWIWVPERLSRRRSAAPPPPARASSVGCRLPCFYPR